MNFALKFVNCLKSAEIVKIVARILLSLKWLMKWQSSGKINLDTVRCRVVHQDIKKIELGLRVKDRFRKSL